MGRRGGRTPVETAQLGIITMRTIVSFLSACALLLAAPAAWAQVTVPNTFTAGTPAKASEVNANFTALANAINNLTANSGGTLTAVTGYSDTYGASSAVADRNVWVYRETNSNTGNIGYSVWMLYKNGTVKVDNATDTTFPYVQAFLSVSSDTGGSTVTSVSEQRRGTNDALGSLTQTYETEDYSYDTSGANETPGADVNAKRVFVYANAPYFNQLRASYLIGFPSSTSSSPRVLQDYSDVWMAFTGSMVINGITFSDVAIDLRPGFGSRRIYAKNVGLVYEDQSYTDTATPSSAAFTLIYARVNGTEYGVSNLTGTPFGSGGALNGVFF